MKNMGTRRWVRAAMAIAGVAVLGTAGLESAQAGKRKPVPPPPAPVAVVVIPPRPMPPGGASPNFMPPPFGADGQYRSPVRGVSPAQTVWNFRAAYNVAALNCNQMQYPSMIEGYRAFLRVHTRGLTAANRTSDAEYRARYGARFIAPREKYLTEVYNHFALPPTVPDFCNAVQLLSQEAQTVPAAQLEAFAMRAMPRIETVFDNFYRAMEQYRADLAAWNVRYVPAVATPAVVTSGPARAQ